MRIRFLYSLLFVTFIIITSVLSFRRNCGMYVWTWGFDLTVAGCDEVEFLKWNTRNRKCFTHTWNTSEKRKWLWNTCNKNGREIDTLFISGFHKILETAYYNNGDCTNVDINLIRMTISERHQQVAGLQKYALFAVDDLFVSEQYLVKYVVWYNDHCAVSKEERFDGVAVNNERYSKLKCGPDTSKQRNLDALYNVTLESGKQLLGILKTHYSIGWHWGLKCNTAALQDEDLLWRGRLQSVTKHMIEIFDSTDVQVAYTLPGHIRDRADIAGYDHAMQQGKPFFTTIYTEKGDIPCQTTFFPQLCSQKEKTENDLFKTIDAYNTVGIGQARPCFHFFRGIYSSGGNDDWPRHNTSQNTSILPVELTTPDFQSSTFTESSTTATAIDIMTIKTSTKSSVTGNSCKLGSYCKCWKSPPVCHGSNESCKC